MCSPAFSFCSKIPKTYDRVPSVCFRVDHHSDETELMRTNSFDAYIQHFSCCIVLLGFRLIRRGDPKNVPVSDYIRQCLHDAIGYDQKGHDEVIKW